MKKIVGLFVFGVAAFIAGWVASNHCNAIEEDDFDLDEIDDVDDTEVDNADSVDTEVETNKETEDEQ